MKQCCIVIFFFRRIFAPSIRLNGAIVSLMPKTPMGRKDGGNINYLFMFNYIFKAVTFTTAIIALYNESRRAGIFKSGKECEKCKPVKGFSV